MYICRSRSSRDGGEDIISEFYSCVETTLDRPGDKSYGAQRLNFDIG